MGSNCVKRTVATYLRLALSAQPSNRTSASAYGRQTATWRQRWSQCFRLAASCLLVFGMSGCGVPSKLAAVASQSPDDGRYECRDRSTRSPAQAVSIDVDSQRKQLLLQLANGQQERLDAVPGSSVFYANQSYAWRFANDPGFAQSQFGPAHQRRGAVLTDIENVTKLNCTRPGLFG